MPRGRCFNRGVVYRLPEPYWDTELKRRLPDLMLQPPHLFFTTSKIRNPQPPTLIPPNYYPPHLQPTSEKHGCLAYRGCQLAPNSLPTRPAIRLSPARADTVLHPTFLPSPPSSKPRTYRTTRHALLSYRGVGKCRTPAIPRCEVAHKGR